MELSNNLKHDLHHHNGYRGKKISWSSIFGGVITVLAISFLLSTLGASLGFFMFEPLANNSIMGVGMSVLIWWLLSMLLSLAAGAYVAGHLARRHGFIHGFIVWALTLIIGSVLGGMLIGNVIKATGSAVSTMASFTGHMVSGAGRMASNSIGSISDYVMHELNLDCDIGRENFSDKIEANLKRTGIKSLQPDFLSQKLSSVKNQATAAIKQIAINPNDADAAIKKFREVVAVVSKDIGKGFDADNLKNLLIQNGDMTYDEAQTAAKNVISAQNKAINEVQKLLSEVESKVAHAPEHYNEFKKKSASVIARSALWSFFALLIGMIVSAFAGLYGVKTCNSCLCCKEEYPQPNVPRGK